MIDVQNVDTEHPRSGRSEEWYAERAAVRSLSILGM